MASTRKLERELSKIYTEAQADMTIKWQEYFKRGEKRLAEKEEELKAAKKTGDAKEIKRLEEDLRQSKENFTFGNSYYRNMVDETTTQLANANATALAYVNGELPSFYSQIYNSEMRAEAKAVGVRFDLVDEATIRRRVMEGDIKLPAKKINIPKDKRWNTKQINASITQGIVQGESMDKIAKRIMPVVDNNRNAAIRNARTLVNGAENAGRFDRYEDLESKGAVLQKVWLATGDDRTRDAHLEMDGQKVDINEPFVDGDGNEIMYPCDPDAAPETVYNCRCSMYSEIVGFINQQGELVKVDGEEDRHTHHDKEIEAEKRRRD